MNDWRYPEEVEGEEEAEDPRISGNAARCDCECEAGECECVDEP